MSTVSALSAIWAIAALSLNTAYQPAGRILEYAPTHSRALRTSPVVCLADSIVIIISFLNLLFQGHGLRQNARVVLYLRSHPVGTDPKTEAKVGPLGFRGQVLFLAALPQMVKVSALQGVPWIQASCLTYSLAFLTVELLKLLAGKDLEDFDHNIHRPIRIERFTSVLGITTAIGQTMLWSYALAAVLHPSIASVVSGRSESLLMWIRWISVSSWIIAGSLLLMFTAALTHGMWLGIAWRPQESRFVYESFFDIYPAILLWAFFAAAFGAHWPNDFSSYTSVLSYTGSLVLLWIIGNVYAGAMSRWMRGPVLMWESQPLKMLLNLSDGFQPVYYVSMNVISLLLYCGFVYNSEGTVLPAWASWLG